MDLIGRGSALSTVTSAMHGASLVTVWGPSGAGKTRLVEEIVRTRLTIEGAPGADWCSLASMRTRDELLACVADTIGARSPGGEPTIRTIARARERKPGRWLVLDGADRAMPHVAELLGAPVVAPVLLTACRASELANERAFELGPLSLEAACELWRVACEERGHTSDEGIARTIVERLDRLPHAILWFAARVAVIGDAAGLRSSARVERLVPLGHRVALDAALETLSPDAREAVFSIASFEAGVTASRLTRSVGPGLEHAEHAVQALIDTSLVRVRPAEGGRLAMLQAYRPVVARVREIAEREGRARADARRHAALVMPVPVDSLGGDGSGSDEELDDLHAELEAIRRRFEDDDPALALEAALALAPIYAREGRAAAAMDAIEELLVHLPLSQEIESENQPENQPDTERAATSHLPRAVARGRVALGLLARRCGHMKRAREELTAVLRFEGDHRFEAQIELASIDRQQSRSPEALSRYEAALEIARTDDNLVRQAIALGELGRVLQSLGRAREARTRHTEAIELAHALGLRRREALERSLHARATHRAGDVREAVALHQAALALHEELGDRHLAAAEKSHLAYCYHELDELDRSETMFGHAVEGLAEAADVALEAIARVLLARLLCDRGLYSGARVALSIAERLTADLDMPRLEYTRELVAGHVALAEARWDDARAQWRAALAKGVLVEVGFEALLPAYLAALEASGRCGTVQNGADDAVIDEEYAPSILLARARASVADIDDDGVRVACEALAAIVDGLPLHVPEDVLARSSEARRVLRLAAALAPAPPTGITLATDGRDAALPHGVRVDLRRRKAPRRLLLALARARIERPGIVLDRDTLIDAGWPGERMRDDAADKRLRTAVWTLRRLGFEPYLLTRDEGYLLDPFIPLAWSEPPDP